MTPEYDDLFPPAGEPTPVPTPEPDDELDDFLSGLDPDEMPTDFVRITSSAGGGVRDIPIDPAHEVNGLPGYTLRDILDMGQLTYTGATQFWAGETQVDLDTVLSSGAVVTAVGVVKGG